MKNIKKLEISHAVEDYYEYFQCRNDKKSLQLPNTLEHLILRSMYMYDLSFLPDLHSLKKLILHEIGTTDYTLRCIAENCLELHTLILTCKNSSIFFLVFLYRYIFYFFSRFTPGTFRFFHC